MKTKYHNRTVHELAVLTVIALGLVLGTCAGHAAAAVGSIGPNFNIRNHKTGQPLQLYSYQGSVVLLDFWAYWCGPCQSAAADMEPNIVQYYRNNGGNANGIPVTVISISIDASDPTAVNNFINTYGLELVGDDTGNAYGMYGNGYIPYMVVLNGTTNSTNFKTWEVRYSTAGYSRAEIKAAIDAVQTPPPLCSISSPLAGSEVPPGSVVLTANITTNGKIIKKVDFYSAGNLLGSDTTAPYSLMWANAPLGTRTVTARAYYGNSSSITSPAVTFTVANPQPIQLSAVKQGDKLVLSWTGPAGNFQVQAATNIESPDWQDVGNPTTDSSVTLMPGTGPAFYRIKRL